jgi:hypothetical protein
MKLKRLSKCYLTTALIELMGQGNNTSMIHNGLKHELACGMKACDVAHML